MLLVIANLVLWIPIKKELQNTAFYKFICCFQRQEGWTGEDGEPKEASASQTKNEQLPSY